jgi:DNA-binding XRE family transcriptional regulator
MSTDMADGNAAAREAEELEDQLDAALVKLARMEQANEETIPLEIVRRLSDGEVPVTVWREYRGFSREELAVAAQVRRELLEAVENGKDDVPLRTMHAIACALRIDLDDLVPWSQESEVPAAQTSQS